MNIENYSDKLLEVNAAFDMARDVHRLSTGQSFEYAYEDMWSQLSSEDAKKRLIAYTALLTVARKRGFSFEENDPTREDVHNELLSIVKSKEHVLITDVFGDELTLVSNDLQAACDYFLQR